MLKQSSLGETAHWAVSFAAELCVEHRPLIGSYSYGVEGTVGWGALWNCARRHAPRPPTALMYSWGVVSA